ncbi:MAG: hypothetical protein AB7D51_02220 [Desulfovibrionaceae bacterium]
MDEKVTEMLCASFAADLYETVKAAKKQRDESVFRHTMLQREDGMLVFCGLYPKADVAQFPGVTDEYAAGLSTFNMMGVITDGRTRLEFFHLGGMNKPLTTLDSANALNKLVLRPQLMAFMQEYFRLRGILVDLSRITYDEFLAVVDAEVNANTSFKELSDIQKLLLKN